MSLTRRSAAVLCSAVLASSTILGSSSIALADDSLSEETRENVVAVADEALVESLEVASTPSITAGDGEVTVSGLDADALALVAEDQRSGVLATTITDAADTPQASFELDMPAGSSAVLNETADVVSYFASDGADLGSASVLWAKDAEGRDLSTRLTLTNNHVTQVVDIEEGAPVTYPIVTALAAAPTYYSSAWVTSQGTKYVVHAVPTADGRYYNTIPYLAAHTQQLKNKLGSNASKVTGTIENQFHCHVIYNHEMGAGNTAYDMESWRPNVSYLVAWTSGCNP